MAFSASARATSWGVVTSTTPVTGTVCTRVSCTFEQISIEEKLIERSDLLKDGQLVDILIHDETETPLSVELPPFVELMITYTEPGIKGDTATNALKPATLETGATVMVPLFVEQDIMIKVDTRDGSYSERVK